MNCDDLLAIIHRDGGHHTAKHGVELSIKHAADKWISVIVELDNIMTVVKEQIVDGSLSFDPVTAPEAYLQSELRRLHQVIETGEYIAKDDE